MPDRPRSEQERISRKLTSLLRHKAAERGLRVDSSGYVNVADIQKLREFRSMTTEDLKFIVANCPKQRFGMTENSSKQLMVRANQGHTMEQVRSEDLCKVVSASDLPKYPVAVHGTYWNAWASIKTSGGLHHMKRNHIHIATGLPESGGVISGMRRTSQVLIYIDLKRAIVDGITFFASANNVLLTAGNEHGILSSRYFAKVIDAATNAAIPF